MTHDEKEMVQFVRERGADLGQLDIMVEDIKCRQAQIINSRGLEAQVKYLLQHRSPVNIRNWVRHEMKILREHGMVTQSKVVPEKNVRIKFKKRRKK